MDGGWADMHPWRVDRAAETPLFRQIYQQVREAIVARALAPGARLPASRVLSERLGVSRTSVVSAYDQLLSEGWLDSRTGSGVYVAQDLPEPFAVRPQVAPEPGARARTYGPDPERLFGPLVPSDDGAWAQRPFAMGFALLDGRGAEAWRRLTHRSVRTFDPRHFGYTDPRGLPELRDAVCAYLMAARGVRCDVDQVLITSGTQHAIDLAVRVLLKPGDDVWVEDPGYGMTWRGLAAAGLRLRPIPVDEQGIDVGEGIRRAGGARAAVVTPSHQYPTGVVLSMARRWELLAWAQQSGAWIVEDDYDSELRYTGRPLASLQGLDEAGRVIYVGTLNKALFPGLRIGYAVVPRSLIGEIVNARHLGDRQPPTLTQTVLADFMREGSLASHFRRMRLLYRRTQATLMAELDRQVGPGRLAFRAPDQGNHLVLWLPDGVSDVALEQTARSRGVACRAISRLYLEAEPRTGLMLGFTGFQPDTLAEPTAILAQDLREAF